MASCHPFQPCLEDHPGSGSRGRKVSSFKWPKWDDPPSTVAVGDLQNPPLLQKT